MAFALVAALSAAQAMPAPTLPPASLIIDQGRADRIQPGALPPSPTPAKAAPSGGRTEVDTPGSGTLIQRVLFEGTKVPAAVAEAGRPFLGQPASRELLGKLAKALSDAYAKSDVALYTIAVPAQDFSKGVVRIRVVEGFIERIDYPKGASPLIRAYGARLAAEKPLTRRALERYLSLMRDIAGAKIEVNLLRGAKAGGVVLSLVTSRKHSQFGFGVDNQGTGQLGRGQLTASAHGYGLLRDGDRTDLSLQSAIDLKRYRYASLAHSTPIGSDGLTASLSGGYLETRPKGTQMRGKAEIFGVSLAYPLIRGYRRNLSVSLSLDGLNSDAAILGSLASSDRTRAIRAAAGYSNASEKRAVSLGLTVSRGLDILGARSLAGISDTQFTKLNLRATIDQQIAKRVIIRARIAGQYSQDRLAAAERLAIGGTDFGRAFENAILSGDRGAAGASELAYRPKLPKKLDGSEVYGFVDGAKIRILSRLNFPGASYDLASAGGGIRLAYGGKASLQLEGARSLNAPYPGLSGDWRLNVGWTLSLH
jgi:hemolysin activation/secretion protein